MKKIFAAFGLAGLLGCAPKHAANDSSPSKQYYLEKIVQCLEEQLQEKNEEKIIEYAPVKNSITVQVKYDKGWKKDSEVKKGLYCDTLTYGNSKICYAEGNNPFLVTDDALLFWYAKSVDVPIPTNINLIIDQGIDGNIDKIVSDVSFAEANSYLAGKNEALLSSTRTSTRPNGHQALYASALQDYYEMRIVNGGRIVDKYPTFLHQCPETVVDIWNENNKNRKEKENIKQ